MANILTDILKPSVVTKIVSRIRTPRQTLSNWFGLTTAGETVSVPGLRSYSYDIYDNTRKIARARLPFAPAGTIAAQAVGNNTVTLARFAEKLPLDYNRISAIRALGENAGVVDRMGKRYVEKQAMTLSQRHANLIEFMVGSLFRGGIWYYFASGDDLYLSYTSTSAFFSNDLKMDTQHKLIGGSFGAGLAMNTGSNTITATWATASNDIPLMLQKVSAGFEQAVGEPLADIFCNHSVWNNVLQNDKVRQLAGTAASPFAGWSKEDAKNPDGSDSGQQIGKIKGLDWLNWHISDAGLDVYDGSSAETFTKTIPDDYCLFSIARGDYLKRVDGTEVVKDNDMAPPAAQTGLYSWVMEKADPARFELHGLNNCALELNVPKALAVARVQ